MGEALTRYKQNKNKKNKKNRNSKFGMACFAFITKGMKWLKESLRVAGVIKDGKQRS